MKIKSVLLAFFIAALIIILLVPVSPVVAYILYGLEFAFPLVMVGFGIYAARKKKIPNMKKIKIYKKIQIMIIIIQLF